MRNTMTAPVIDRLLFQFDTGFVNARPYSKDVMDAMEPLFSIMADLAPLPKNDEVKMIWLKIPRGTLEDFGDFQQILDDGEVKSREEFEELWHEEYPDEYKWYQLFLVESLRETPVVHGGKMNPLSVCAVCWLKRQRFPWICCEMVHMAVLLMKGCRIGFGRVLLNVLM